MNILLDGIVFGLQRYGGISNYWMRLLTYMGALQDVEANVLLPKTLRSVDFRESGTLLPIRKDILPTGLARYLDVRADPKCEIFHSSYYRVPTDSSINYVTTVYDFIYERYSRGLSRSLHSWQKIRSINRAALVVCISNATRDDVLRYVTGVDPDRLRVVYLGVDEDDFFPETSVDKSCFENLVLYVGQRGDYKRFDLAVLAVEELHDLGFGIVGPALTRDEIQFLDKHLLGRWNWFGEIPKYRLRQLYSSAFAFIFPSDYEGFGLPVLEAMACGCPVVAANRASLPEVGGGAAIYASDQQVECFVAALDKLRSSSAQRQVHIDAGFQQAKLFSWQRTFNETVAVYQELSDT